MIVEFSIGNYRSFNQMQTLSFKATGLVSENKSVDERNIIDDNGTKCLKIAGIYGANASGKSNALEGLKFFSDMLISSIELEGMASLVNPFKFVSEPQNNEGYFQIILIVSGVKYRYGFTIGKKMEIQEEWLFGPASKNETYYFRRKGSEIDSNPEWFSEGLQLPKDKLRSDSLFLTFCSSYDGPISRAIRDYFRINVSFDGLTRYPDFFRERNQPQNDVRPTDRLILDGKNRIVLAWLRAVGMNYADIGISMVGGAFRPKPQVHLLKNVYNKEGQVARQELLYLDRDESGGTQKYYNYIGELIQKFENGGLFVSDEIDNNFHPSLLKRLISLFQNAGVNKGNAQLLFTSHDTNLMNPEYMRRDQFYFAEKTRTEETNLYSLSDLKGIRNNADFARQYLSGAYGALPVLGNYLEESENNR
ncbi:ATP/GTP-binding protein [Chitinophaga sp. S165]|uniref:AAA family ATPase n=1 Tax=Chitinophaga sp. S165 TaxID=2135462 RepID=UPI000D71173D|nr:ATP-binding protein [Chitinophaga sp. S165]PWV55811.1 hypothetical protein C7475_101318 [Chitinophaga sp. S165]